MHEGRREHLLGGLGYRVQGTGFRAHEGRREHLLGLARHVHELRVRLPKVGRDQLVDMLGKLSRIFWIHLHRLPREIHILFHVFVLFAEQHLKERRVHPAGAEFLVPRVEVVQGVVIPRV